MERRIPNIESSFSQQNGRNSEQNYFSIAPRRCCRMFQKIKINKRNEINFWLDSLRMFLCKTEH